MEAVFQWMLNHWQITAFLLGGIIQIVPAIKWNPLTALVNWIGRVIIKPAMDRLADMEKKIIEIQAEQQAMRLEQMADEKDRIRYEVLDFANSCRNGRRHTRDEFQHIIDLNDKYEKLLEKTKDTNGVFTEEYQYIVGLYHRCQAENDFLA